VNPVNTAKASILGAGRGGVRRRSFVPEFGAVLAGSTVRFRLWAPAAQAVQVHVRPALEGQVGGSRAAPTTSEERVFDLTPAPTSIGVPDQGIWEIWVPSAHAGDRYAFVVDGRHPRPDPASRFQPDGVSGWSEIVDPDSFSWTDIDWRGLDPTRAVIYELHVGTFTPEGTFRGVVDRLPYLRDLGVTAIELMPLADFSGDRNWGYDGTALFAPSRAYGRPDDLRALIDAAHNTGLAVLVDVVYNHLGPEGAYLPELSPRFLTAKHATPWGGAVNLDDEGSEVVRRLLIENALHWVHEYHVDGLRLDATHALIDESPRHFVAELTAAVHEAADPQPLVYAEDHRNLAAMLEEPSRDGWGLDGVWADDFHHVVRKMLAGDTHGYYVDYEGNAFELADTLRRGWLFTGQRSRHHNAPRGTDPSCVEMRKAIVCVQNHDQVGNRALGDRLHHTADAAAWRAAVTVLLTAPMTPLLFMGQEWAARSPFQFFTDFSPELGRLVLEGRQREFSDFPEFHGSIPDPQAEATFATSRLRWEEQADPPHREVLALHRALLQLRAARDVLHASDGCEGDAEAPDGDTIVMRRGGTCREAILVVARLRGKGPVTVTALTTSDWHLLLSTEDGAFTNDPRPARVDEIRGLIEFDRPGATLFARTGS
jgi:maltooligosyltrehalose trehalohydrolase